MKRYENIDIIHKSHIEVGEEGYKLNSKDFKIQLNRIAQIVGREFGVLDESGLKLYNSDGNDIEINFPEEFKNDAEENEFVYKQGYCFLKYTASDNTIYLYMKSESGIEEEKRILQLAALAYENKEAIQKSIVNDFFQTLLIEGSKSVNQSDLTQYGILSLRGFIVVVVSIGKENYISQSESEMIITILKGIFSSFQNIQIVTINSQKYSIICSLNEENEYLDVLQISETLKDTFVSELMVDTSISVGSLINKLSDINISYKDAETAREAGLIFGLDKKSYIYDKLGVERLIYGLPVRNCVSFLKETLGAEFLNDKNAKELLYTVKIFLDNNQNVSESARMLYIHRNTLVYRLDKFNKLTNLDSTRFEEGMKIGIALMIMKYLEKRAPGELNL